MSGYGKPGRFCNTMYHSKTSTSRMVKHAWEVHRIDIKGHDTAGVSVVEQLKKASHDKKSLYGLGILDKIKLFFLHWVICMHIPFTVVENAHFRSFFSIFNASLFTYIPISNQTIHTWIMTEF